MGGTNTENEQEEKFFTPLESLGRGELELEKVGHNLEVQVDKTTPSRYAHLEVNSCSHATVVEQLMSWIKAISFIQSICSSKNTLQEVTIRFYCPWFY
jgi:hypothetical protein